MMHIFKALMLRAEFVHLENLRRDCSWLMKQEEIFKSGKKAPNIAERGKYIGKRFPRGAEGTVSHWRVRSPEI